jgi:hypothetical protein
MISNRTMSTRPKWRPLEFTEMEVIDDQATRGREQRPRWVEAWCNTMGGSLTEGDACRHEIRSCKVVGSVK